MATLLGRKELVVDGRTLPRGQFLVMGGDEVYPKASRQAYTNQLRQAYAWASPDHDRHSRDGVPVFAIPGNHDWYDGLDLFLAFFCREKHWHLGSWRSRQRRSYFAIQLTQTWWLWATDIQLADTMDQPQADYFNRIATSMPDNSKIIMCSAEPGWLYTDTNSKSWEITDFAVGLAVEARKPDGTSKGHTVPLLLSGDTHHYSRYESADTQFITSGGGGAFLHPTHHLEQSVSLKWLTTKKKLQLGKIPDLPAERRLGGVELLFGGNGQTLDAHIVHMPTSNSLRDLNSRSNPSLAALATPHAILCKLANQHREKWQTLLSGLSIGYRAG
jgi:hypothetical protein